jgi:Protein of unknown function (DUF3551)
MRIAPIAIAVLTAILVADVQSAAAQESFFNERYCTRRMGGFGSGGGAGLDCAFHTWEQCIASARGLGRYCIENPSWRPAPPRSGARTTRDRRSR